MTGKFIISLDFEKYWGIRDHVGIEDYEDNLRNVDTVIDQLLSIFSEYGIHATWGVVGFLLYKNQDSLKMNLPQNTHIYTNLKLNPYDYILSESLSDVYHFAHEKIKLIQRTPFQEIASHTFSHYYCLEKGQSVVDFEMDLLKFNEICNLEDIEINSIIFPRNQINQEYVSILEKHGIYSYRGNEDSWIYRATTENKSNLLVRFLRFLDRYISLSGTNTYQLKKSNKVLNIKSSRLLAPYIKKFSFIDFIRLRRIKKSMSYAAKNNRIFHLWWHPHNFGTYTKNNLQFLNKILKHYLFLKEKYGFESVNMMEIVKERYLK
ncbi:MAG: polysaccharide deacetylase family protein [Halanaerobiales bacterium]|nr:polysaccharide deacetylase family protein [Halanaerobiales bacterium]